MNQTLIEMAQRARQNEVLCAGLIHQYRERLSMPWEELARTLKMDSVSLARLALCRSPRPNHLDQDTEKIAAYLGIEKTDLLNFFRVNLPPIESRPGLFETIKTTLTTQPPKRYAYALAIISIIVLVGALIAFSPLPATATLVVTSGQVTVQAAGKSEQIVTPGQVASVKTGDNLALKPGAAAQLRFYDGSTVELSENTRLEVQELAINEDQFRVRLHLLTGRTVSRVLRLLGVGDVFEINTPSSTISVRGTVFTVQVIDNNTTYVACEKGVVKVASGKQQAEVKAGQELTARPDQPLEVKPISSEETDTPEDGKESLPPTQETEPVIKSTPLPTNITEASPFASPEETPVPPDTDPVNNESQSTGLPPQSSDLPPAVTSDSNSPQSSPNSPSQVPGKPPSVVPGNGNPPSGGSEPPGKGGEPPGQTKDKPNKKDKDK